MLQAKRKPKALNGAALMMVLTVMFVLIFMLAGTMAVVYSAYNRALAKYEEGQGYYSARSVLDIFCEDLLTNDADLLDGEYQYYISGDDVEESATEISEARQLEFDLYKLNVSTSSDYYQNFEGNKLLINGDSNTFSVSGATNTSNASSYKDQYTPDSSYGDTYVYEISSTELTNLTSDVDGKLADGSTNALVYVQLLERCYDTGSVDAESTKSMSSSEVAAAVQSGSRKRDHFKLKVTATIYYDGIDYSTSYIFENTYTPPVSSGGAIEAIGSVTSSGAGLKTNGGYSSLNAGDETKINAATVTGSIFNTSGIYIDSSGTYTLSENEGMVAFGDIFWGNSMSFVSSGEGSYIYCYKLLDLNNAVTIGSATNSVDLIAHEVVTRNGPTIYGNVYSDYFYYKCGKYDTVEATVNGTIYTDYLIVSTDYISNNNGVISWIVSGFKNYIVYGVLLVFYKGSDLTLTDYDNEISATYASDSNIISGAITQSSTPVNIDYFDTSQYVLSGTNKVLTMPDGKTYSIPTFASIYSEKLNEEDSKGNSVFDSNGDVSVALYNSDGTENFDAFNEYVNANIRSLASTINSISGVTYYEDSRTIDNQGSFKNNLTTLSKDAGDDIDSSVVISSGAYTMSVNYNNQSTYIVDLTKGNVIIQFEDPSSESDTYRDIFEVYWKGDPVHGDGSVTEPAGSLIFIFPGGESESKSVTYNVGGTGDDYSFKIYYPGITNSGQTTSGTKIGEEDYLNLGSITSGSSTTPPKVYYYCDGYATINIQSPKGFCVGYWNVPKSTINISTGLSAFCASGQFDGISFSSQSSWCLGAVICYDYNCPQSTAVQYIAASGEDTDDSKANFNWAGIAYVAS